MNMGGGQGRSMIEDHVLKAIRSGEAKMRPRWYFTVRATLAFMAVILLFFVALIIVSVSVFALQANGGIFAASFGVQGLWVFLYSLPWALLALSIALLIVLGVVLERYSFAYHQPFLYLLLFLLVIVSIASALIASTSLRGSILRYVSADSGIPVVPAFYARETAPVEGLYRGAIVAISAKGFVLENTLGQTSTVVLSSGAVPELRKARIGEYVMVFGYRSTTGTVVASGIEKTSFY